jgi:NADH-quinone oxidoreductase subunit N
MKALILIFSGAILLLFSGLGKSERRMLPLVWLTLLLALVMNGLEYFGWELPWEQQWMSMLRFNKFSLAFNFLLIMLAFLASLLFVPRLEDKGADVFALMLFSLCGALLMTSFNSFFMLFLGLEIMSIPLYVLAGSRKEDLRSNEAALKYYLMGSFATAILLFGVAMVYGTTGSFDIYEIGLRYTGAAMLTGLTPMAKIGILMVLFGLLFKIAAAPFHFWAPDVYTGSPGRVTAFMATVVKTAGIVAMFRIYAISFGIADNIWGPSLAVLAALTMLVGNLSALRQNSLKRMLAYSSVAHAGYLLLAILVHNPASSKALLLYMTGYGLAALVAFALIQKVNREQGSEDVSAFNGLAKRYPLESFALLISLLSMTGIPGTAGFAGKYFLFSSAFTAYTWLIILALVLSAVSVAYYFRAIIAMYFKDADISSEEGTTSVVHVRVALIACTLLNIAAGVAPWVILEQI